MFYNRTHCGFLDMTCWISRDSRVVSDIQNPSTWKILVRFALKHTGHRHAIAMSLQIQEEAARLEQAAQLPPPAPVSRNLRPPLTGKRLWFTGNTARFIVNGITFTVFYRYIDYIPSIGKLFFPPPPDKMSSNLMRKTTNIPGNNLPSLT